MIWRRFGQGMEYGIEQVGLKATVFSSSIEDGLEIAIRHGPLVAELTERNHDIGFDRSA